MTVNIKLVYNKDMEKMRNNWEMRLRAMNKKKLGVIALFAMTLILPFSTNAKEDKVKGFVYLDANYNSIKDKQEKPLDDLEIKVYNQKDKLIETVKTDVEGHYTFTKPDEKYYLVTQAMDNYALDNNSNPNYQQASEFQTKVFDKEAKIDLGYGLKPLVKQKTAIESKVRTNFVADDLMDYATFTKLSVENPAFECSLAKHEINCLANKEASTIVSVNYQDNYQREASIHDFILIASNHKSQMHGYLQLVDVKNNQVDNANIKTTLDTFDFELLDNEDNLIAKTSSDEKGYFKFKELLLPDGDYQVKAINKMNDQFIFAKTKKDEKIKTIKDFSFDNNQKVVFNILDNDTPQIQIKSDRNMQGFNPTKIETISLYDASTTVKSKYKLVNLDTKEVTKSEKVELPKQEGHYQLHYYALDASKNKSVKKVHEFKIDKSQPEVNFVYQAKNNIPQIKLAVKDNMDEKPQVKWFIKDQKDKVVASQTQAQFDNQLLERLENGKYYIALEVSDSAGNKTTAKSKTLEVKNHQVEDVNNLALTKTQTPTLISNPMDKSKKVTLVIVFIMLSMIVAIKIYRSTLVKQ